MGGGDRPRSLLVRWSPRVAAECRLIPPETSHPRLLSLGLGTNGLGNRLAGSGSL